MLKADNVVGLPKGVPLKHPSHLKHDELQAIHIALPSIKFIGKCIKAFLVINSYTYMYAIDVPPLMPTHTDHSYACTSNELYIDNVKEAHGFTTLATVSSKSIIATLGSQTTTVKEGDDVHLLNDDNRTIGMGTIIGGNKLHNNDLPSAFVKVAVKEIITGTKPWPQIVSFFDDEFLVSGSITGWPQNKLAI